MSRQGQGRRAPSPFACYVAVGEEGDPVMNPLTSELCAHAIAGSTGALGWTDGKRRRTFYFELGQLLMLQSNLKSEGTERIAELNPALSGNELQAASVQARVAGSLKEAGGEAQWTPNAAPPRREPADLGAALREATPQRSAASSSPTVVGAGGGWIHRQGMPADLAGYLGALDGARSLDEVVAFAPAEPAEAERWITTALAIGAMTDVGTASATYEVRRVQRRPTAPRPAEDIAWMIAEGLGQEPVAPPTPAPVDPVATRLGPTAARIRGASNHFDVLGVKWDEPQEVARKAYFTLARELHPDGFSGAPAEIQAAAAELFDTVRGAWEVLKDDTLRTAYIKKVVHGEKTEDEVAMDKVRAILEAEGEFTRALLDFSSGRIAQAHECFLRVSAAVPEEAEFSAYAGYTSFRMNTGKDAEKAEAGLAQLRAAVERSEKLDSGWVLLGHVHHSRGAPVESREAYIRALKINPSNPDAVRGMKRLERDKAAIDEAASGGSGLFRKLFGGKS